MPGTPHGVVSVYYDQDGKPGMAHCCAIKNRPNLSMGNSTGDTIHFNCTGSDCININREAQMHELAIRFVDEGRIGQGWVLYQDSKPVETTHIELQRL